MHNSSHKISIICTSTGAGRFFSPNVLGNFSLALLINQCLIPTE